jgi:hypothetical protein
MRDLQIDGCCDRRTGSKSNVIEEIFAGNSLSVSATSCAVSWPAPRTSPKRLREPSLPQNGIRCVPTRNPDRHGEISSGDRAMPDLMAALALADKSTPGSTRQIPKSAIELRGHSGGHELGFAQSGDLQINRRRVDARMVVRKKVEHHRGNLRQQLVKSRSVGRRRDVVTVSGPDGSFVIPGGRDGEDQRFGHSAWFPRPSLYNALLLAFTASAST